MRVRTGRGRNSWVEAGNEGKLSRTYGKFPCPPQSPNSLPFTSHSEPPSSFVHSHPFALSLPCLFLLSRLIFLAISFLSSPFSSAGLVVPSSSLQFRVHSPSPCPCVPLRFPCRSVRPLPSLFPPSPSSESTRREGRTGNKQGLI